MKHRSFEKKINTKFRFTVEFKPAFAIYPLLCHSNVGTFVSLCTTSPVFAKPFWQKAFTQVKKISER